MARKALAFVLGGAVLGATACGPAASAEFATLGLPVDSRATIAAQPAASGPVSPDQRIVVTASDGLLADVTVIGPKGPLRGQLSDDGTVWTARRASLEFGAEYTVQATAIDPRGAATSVSQAIRTVEPSEFFTATVSPGKGETVGAGMPITVTFDRPVRNRPDVERALVVRTTTPVIGAWSWQSPTQVQFRPRKYWPGNTEVVVSLDLKGVKARKGVYGKASRDVAFGIGPRMVTRVNAQTHTARVFRDGVLIKTLPITTGKDGFETRSGVKVIVSKERSRIMDAATGGTAEGDPEYYRVEAEYAMRVTYSGEFVHAAPWSTGSQGSANVSHGCIGMSTANAAWLYDLSSVGDVVEVTGTSAQQNLGNGITVWNEAWEDWLAGSTVGPVTTSSLTGPDPVAVTAAAASYVRW
jgi:lipoprotein-anchoring transpeptidase ErfK/SrfK